MDFSKHSTGTTSVKVHHAPGGGSNFSLAWGDPEPAKKTAPKVTPVTNPAPLKETNQVQQPTQGQQAKGPDAKTSVKVHNPPGGRSNICFG